MVVLKSVLVSKRGSLWRMYASVNWFTIGLGNGLLHIQYQSSYPSQCWSIINWILGNKLEWNSNQNTNTVTTLYFLVCKLCLLSRNNWQRNPSLELTSEIARFTRPTWGPPGSCRPQVGPILALLSGWIPYKHTLMYQNQAESGLVVAYNGMLKFISP